MLPDWTNRDAYLIGGGPSLTALNFDVFRGLNTIGCNSACILGPEVCKICVFCDWGFHVQKRTELLQFIAGGGIAVSNHEGLEKNDLGITWFPRIKRGLVGNGERFRPVGGLTFSMSTGAAAIHLAMILGARRVYLFGYDMGHNGKNNNWHGCRIREPDVYKLHRDGIGLVVADMPQVYPGREIIQVVMPGMRGMEEYFPVVEIGDILGDNWRKQIPA